ncbi:GIY-YIG nuclease family protein [Rhodobium gokarnense]|uniref:Uri superfamily endonuclease n=1 Tax=Rhodobium gokarnense TaxID=364296 RepID=A0ABT3H9K3_9HYPH|nr:GIY-YIG nuclease family protein [Rhodobium gokarnense]MCW2306976.1 Uri superfamily endonuclease [Rhodobium gokarnense]
MSALMVPPDLHRLLARAGLGARVVRGAEGGGGELQLPRAPGAYVLVLGLAEPAALPARFGEAMLPPGWYLYCGSARGPGGIAARLGRHLRREKKNRWHIDALTIAAGTIEAAAVPDGDECALVSKLSAFRNIDVPVPGFGSTDCRRCASHLLRWRSTI